MFRSMRRFRQQLDDTACTEVLRRATSGVLAVAGDDGYPYAVPLSFVYDEDRQRLLFHCATSGHKLDAIRRCDKVSFCVIDRDEVVAEEYTSHYRSVIVFGRCRVIEDNADIRAALDTLTDKYVPDDTAEQRRAATEPHLGHMYMLALEIEYVSGKQARELCSY